MPKASRQDRKEKVIAVLNKARGMELQAISQQYMNQHYNLDNLDYGELAAKVKLIAIDEEQAHFNYFDNVHDHIESLGATYLAKIAGTPSSTGAPSKGFVIGGAGE